VRTLADLRAWNRTQQGALRYGQAQLDRSDAIDLEAARARAVSDLARDRRLAGEQGLDAAIASHRLDALVFPGPYGAALAARAGAPTVIVPFGLVPNDAGPPFPSGFEPRPAPLGISFTGPACSEPRLIELAYAFEQATRRRVPPGLP
jgi:amidase